MSTITCSNVIKVGSRFKLEQCTRCILGYTTLLLPLLKLSYYLTTTYIRNSAKQSMYPYYTYKGSFYVSSRHVKNQHQQIFK